MIEEYVGGTLARAFVCGGKMDEPILIETGGATYYYARDIQGSIRAVVNSSGGLVESYEYTPFGLMRMRNAQGQDITASTIGNPYGYTGQRWDAESALWHYKNRMYSAPLGRFLQRDPAGYVDGMNLYAYVRNNPLRYTDPEGLAARNVYYGLSESLPKVWDGLQQSYSEIKEVPDIAWNNISLASGYSSHVPAVLYPDGRRTDSLPSTGGRIGTNGVGGDYQALYDENYDAWLYNPSNGFFWDLVETAQELIAGPGSWSVAAAKMLDVAAASGAKYDFVAHSQGGVQLGEALYLMTNTFENGSSVRFVNTPYDPGSAGTAAEHANLSLEYFAEPRDVVATLGNPGNIAETVMYMPVYFATGGQIHYKDVYKK